MQCKKLMTAIFATSLVFSSFSASATWAAEPTQNTVSSGTSTFSKEPVTKTIGGVTITNISSIREKTGFDHNGNVIFCYYVDVLNNSTITAGADQSQFYFYLMNTFNEPTYEMTMDKDYVCPAYRYSIEDMGIAPHPTKQSSDGTWSAGLRWDLNFTARPTYFIRTDVGGQTTYFCFGQVDSVSAFNRFPEAYRLAPSSSQIYVDQKPVTMEIYPIMDSSYIKLDDLSQALNGTTKQFQYRWNIEKGAMEFLLGQPYQNSAIASTKLETSTPQSVTTVDGKTEYLYYFHSASFLFNGNSSYLNSCVINGNLCVRLRDVAQKMNFYVGWDAAKNAVVIDTSKGYQE